MEISDVLQNIRYQFRDRLEAALGEYKPRTFRMDQSGYKGVDDFQCALDRMLFRYSCVTGNPRVIQRDYSPERREQNRQRAETEMRELLNEEITEETLSHLSNRMGGITDLYLLSYRLSSRTNPPIHFCK